ncbi:NADH-quinone oxidoreductase subunit NuoE [Buchnera aphidicola]|uniref:NADH-quinone oxidoreductase subunit NuoE n=1 Tax=Buchnera aphidicola TaxID=9 RepID=UPI0030EC6882
MTNIIYKNKNVSFLSKHEIKEIKIARSHYPNSQAAIIECLKIVQKYRRWVCNNSIKEISKILKISSSEIESIATFYNQIFRKPVGKNIIRICDSFVCFIMGYKKIKNFLCKSLKINYGETTQDNKFTLLPTCCLGACDKGPVIMINKEIYFFIKKSSVVNILGKYK